MLAEVEVLITGWGCPLLDAAALGAAPRLRAVVHTAGSVRGHLTPHLPAEHLAEDWPAIRAEQLFHELATRYRDPAAAIAAQVIEEIPAGPTG